MIILQNHFSRCYNRNMKTKLLVISISALLSALIEYGIHPNFFYELLLLILFIVVIVDFFSAVLRSLNLSEEWISDKVKRTTIKVGNYFNIIIGSWVISFIISYHKNSFSTSLSEFINATCVIFFIYNELLSICENIIASDEGGRISQIIKPIHLFLQWRFLGSVFKLMNKEYDYQQKEKSNNDGK